MELAKIPTQELRKLSTLILRELNCRDFKRMNIASPQAAKKSMDMYIGRDQLNVEVQIFNSANLLAMNLGPRESFNEKRIYAKSLMQQNWSHLFDQYECESTKFYVYAHVDPRIFSFACKEINCLPCQGQPFYIGKGCGDRAYDMKRNQGHGKMIAYLRDKGCSDDAMVKILFDGLSERSAMEIESKIIYFFGTVYEKCRKGTLYNLDISKRPDFTGLMQKKIKRPYVPKNISQDASEI